MVACHYFWTDVPRKVKTMFERVAGQQDSRHLCEINRTSTHQLCRNMTNNKLLANIDMYLSDNVFPAIIENRSD